MRSVLLCNKMLLILSTFYFCGCDSQVERPIVLKTLKNSQADAQKSPQINPPPGGAKSTPTPTPTPLPPTNNIPESRLGWDGSEFIGGANINIIPEE